MEEEGLAVRTVVLQTLLIDLGGGKERSISTRVVTLRVTDRFESSPGLDSYASLLEML